ncbi:MAG: hypothetical protein HZB38_14840 [Planctomycetes bacterium]|nr:hypothetical protein [Planctomycetota bacterium]
MKREPSRPNSPEPILVIERGTCRALFVYDVGQAIDLPHAERLVTSLTERGRIRRTRRAPEYFEFETPPLRVRQSVSQLPIAGFLTDEEVQILLYDFGAVTVGYSLAIPGPLAQLVPLADELYENDTLRRDSRSRVEEIARTLSAAIRRPALSSFVEDYVTFELNSVQGLSDVRELREKAGGLLAQILRAELTPLSDQEIEDALHGEVSFGRGDTALIDWNAAILVDREPDDVRAVLEFANVELLEMRYLDDQLDDALEEAGRVIADRRSPPLLALTKPGAAMRRIAALQMDATLLFEDVNNTLKLLGDQYLARVYRSAAQRLHLPDWDASILRKLDTLDSIYQKLTDQQMQTRMELLEWIIILLIAVSIGLPFVSSIARGH